MVTLEQLKDLNKRIDTLKDKNSSALAELKVLQGQFDAKAKTLSEMLNIPVTAENVETLYTQAQRQLEEKAAKVEELLRDLEGGGEAPYRQPGTPAMNFGSGMGYIGGQASHTAPVGFGTPSTNPQPAGFPVPDSPLNFGTPATPVQAAEEQGVTPIFANFGTGTTFNI